MHQLFRDLAKGRGWPTCPEGNASGLHHEPYYPCPSGMTAVGGRFGGGGDDGYYSRWTPNQDGDVCADLSKPTTECSGGGHGDRTCETVYPSASRQRRTEPYYVDITSGAGNQRFYFSLEGY